MLNQADNELLTRVGRGTAMGAMLREYWVPACRSAKLEPDGAPERVRLFGENFVAFRATDGRVGFMQEACPHRCASLALARNEGNGLRCIFHGWKFSVEGKCVDAPTEPRASATALPKACRSAAYPVHEAGGLVWVYMGETATPPRFPDYEFTALPDEPCPALPRNHPDQLAAGSGGAARLGARHVPALRQPQQHDRAATTSRTKATSCSATARRCSNSTSAPTAFAKARSARNWATCSMPACARSPCRSSASFPARPGGRASCAARSRSTTSPPRNGTSPTTPTRRWGADMIGAFGNVVGRSRPLQCRHGRRRRTCGGRTAQAMEDGHWSGIIGRGNAYEDFAVQESMGPIVDRTQGIPRHLRPRDLPRPQAAARSGQAPPRYGRALVRRRRHRIRRASARSASPIPRERTGATWDYLAEAAE